MSTFAKIVFSERISNPTTNGRVGLDIHNPFIGLFLPFIPSAASFGVSIIVYIDEKIEKSLMINWGVIPTLTEKPASTDAGFFIELRFKTLTQILIWNYLFAAL